MLLVIICPVKVLARVTCEQQNTEKTALAGLNPGKSPTSEQLSD
jgi:hypothetical protein